MQSTTDILKKCLMILSPYWSGAEGYLMQIETQTLEDDDIMKLLDVIQDTLSQVTDEQQRVQGEKRQQQLRELELRRKREISESETEAGLILTQLDG